MRRISQFIGVIIITLLLGTGFQVAAQTAGSSAAAFKTGQSVATTDTVNVRAGGALDGIVLGTQAAGAKGEVMSEAPVVSGGYTWYRINFQSGVDGWVVSQYLRSVAVPVGIEIAAFYASPNKVTTNGSSTIYWDVNGADTCVLTSQVGSAAAKTLRTNANVKGMEVVKNLQTTTKYKLACTKGTTSKVEKTVTVTVSETPVSKPTSTSTPPRGSGTETFTSGQSVMTLDSVEVKQSPATSSRTLGTQPKSKKGVVSPEVAKEADGYRWYRVNFDGGVDGWVPAVFLSSVGLGVGAQINSFYASPSTIAPNESVTMTWDAIGVNECKLYKNYGTPNQYLSKENAGITGIHKTSGVEETTKFTLRCTKGSTQVEKTITVTVKVPEVGANGKPKPVCDSATALPPTITKGQQTTLKWTTSNASKVVLTSPTASGKMADISVPVDGTWEVSPSVTWTFTLTATGPGGTSTCKIPVTVVEPTQANAAITLFSAAPTTVASGSKSTLVWASKYTRSCSIMQGSTVVASNLNSNGSYAVTPKWQGGVTEKYTLSCLGATATGSTTVKADVTVTQRQAIPKPVPPAASSTGQVRGASIDVYAQMASILEAASAILRTLEARQ